MVKGQLRVVGTPQHLKDKYGSGYEIVAQLDAAVPPGAALNVAAHLEVSHIRHIARRIRGVSSLFIATSH